MFVVNTLQLRLQRRCNNTRIIIELERRAVIPVEVSEEGLKERHGAWHGVARGPCSVCFCSSRRRRRRRRRRRQRHGQTEFRDSARVCLSRINDARDGRKSFVIDLTPTTSPPQPPSRNCDRNDAGGRWTDKGTHVREGGRKEVLIGAPMDHTTHSAITHTRTHEHRHDNDVVNATWHHQRDVIQVLRAA